MSAAIPSRKPVPSIGPYHLITTLGEGRAGPVHLGLFYGPDGFNKLLAIKELKAELSQDTAATGTFHEEARLATSLVHPNIVDTLESAQDRGRHYVVMEYLDGTSLHRVIRKMQGHAALTVGAQLAILCRTLVALEYAHDLEITPGVKASIVHRDLCPAHIFVTYDGHVKLLGFGIPDVVDDAWGESKTDVLRGHVGYMAPEQTEGRSVDRRADIFAVGVMIWEAVAGRRLLQEMGKTKGFRQHAGDDPPRLSTVCPGVPADLDAICARALTRRPEARYQTAATLRQDLEFHLGERTDVPELRSFGGDVAVSFAEERRAIAEAIDSTLARLCTGPFYSDIPPSQIPVTEGEMAPSTVSSRREPQGPSRRDEKIPSRREGQSEPPPASVTRRWESIPPVTNSTSAQTERARQSTPPPAHPHPLLDEPVPGELPPTWQRALASPLAKWMIAGAALMIGFSGAALVLSVRHARHSVPQAVATDPLNGASAAASLAEDSPTALSRAVQIPARAAERNDDLVDVTLRVTPPSAQLTVDGSELTSNPFHGRYAKDGQMHHLIATADGYVPKLLEISFAADVAVDVSLEKYGSSRGQHRGSSSSPSVRITHPSRQAEAVATSISTSENAVQVPAPASAPTAAPVPPAPVAVTTTKTALAAGTTVDPAGGQKPSRPIVTSNPYATKIVTNNPYGGSR